MAWQDDALAQEQPKASTEGGDWQQDTPIEAEAVKAAVGNSQANPQAAADAFKLSRKVGLPPVAVEANYPEVFENSRANEASQAALSNSAIAAYITSNSMASKVSADDWGNLQNMSNWVREIEKGQVDFTTDNLIMPSIWERVKHGVAEGFSGENIENSKKQIQQWPISDTAKSIILNYPSTPFTPTISAWDVLKGAGYALEAPMAALYGASGFIGGVAQKLGVPEAWSNRLERDLAQIGIVGFTADGVRARTSVKTQIQLKTLDKVIDTAQESATKQRSPELFENFIEAHGVNEPAYIDPALAIKLYEAEGKAISDPKGPLGWVPDLEVQINRAQTTGEEIVVPSAKYIANVEPSVHKALQEGIRLGDDGVTLSEAVEISKELQKKIDEPQVKPVEEVSAGAVQDSVRRLQEAIADEEASRGLKPLFSEAPPDVAKPLFERYSKRIAEQQLALEAKATEVAETYMRRQLTPAWKKEFEQTVNEARIDLANRPDIATDIFLRTGKLPSGEVIDVIKLDRASVERLIPDLAEGLKKYTTKNGVDPDLVAKVFGFTDGEAMLGSLHGLLGQRAEAGKGPLAFFETIAKEEANRRMEGKYGTLPELIKDAAKQIIDERAKPEVLHEELRMIANAAGHEVPFTKEQLIDAVQKEFAATKVSDVMQMKKLERAILRAWKEVEQALSKGDFIEAFKARQKQVFGTLLQKELKEFQKVTKSFTKNADFISGESAAKSVDAQALEHMRQLLAKLGDEESLRYSIGKTEVPLEQFVANSEGQMQVADWLFDRNLPKLAEMTVEDYKDVASSIKSMLHVGRQQKKLFNIHGAAEFDNVLVDVIKQLERFNPVENPINPSLRQRASSLWRYVIASHALVERVMDYTDQFNPKGPLTSYLDRPLRDANTKEIKLIELVTADLRKLAKYTDASIDDVIPNRVIPREGNTTGFADLTRRNLRQLMLYMGSESGIRKVEGGFGVDRKAVMKLIHDNATEADWRWSQGMWDIYNNLHREASEVYIRDTGVPVDKVEPTRISTKFGFDVTGGYTPINYDRDMSNIAGHLRAKDPVFDNNYRSALPSNGYTKRRTEYFAPLDLTGMYTASELRSSVHDIAFREAIRNANKLINNGEFKMAMQKYWGKEYAQLFPGWIRQIANVQNFDAEYGRGLARGLAEVRQNLTNSLIAFNPGTFMKHGGAAAIMSADRVGVRDLAGAASQLKAKDVWNIGKDLIKKSDPEIPTDWVEALRQVNSPTEYGANVREFVLNSSAVMRNRQRKYVESIRGAQEKSSNAGIGQSLAEFRQDAMTLGRAPVAFSDALSAIPTWYAAYKKAILTMDHADAVFVADKEVSRAHGSSFVGDRPAVMQIPNSASGEVAKYFVGLYNFWNHQMNNQLQLAWDIQAKASSRAEPGANIPSIARRFALTAAIIAIEELAAPPLTDHGGLLKGAFLSTIRFFGGQLVGVREFTNAIASGYEPSMGMMGTLGKTLWNQGQDISRGLKGKPMSDKWLIHLAATIGLATGVGGAQPGRTTSYLIDVSRGKQRPANITQFRQGLRTGTQKPPKH